MNVSLNCEAENRDFDLKGFTLFVDHHIVSLHGAHRGFNHCTAGVLKFIAGCDMRLFADYAFALNFGLPAVTIGNQPVASQQLHR